ncbi:MAG: glutaredoxin family protein [Betaproteobacteria bacterium]
MKAKLTLYGRRYCHLCEEMAAALRSRGIAFDEVDVDADPALEERYGELVPVLARPDGTEICHYHLDVAALEAAIAQI